MLAGFCISCMPRDVMSVQGSKKGTGYGFGDTRDLQAMQKLGWWYNWGVQTTTEVKTFSQGHGIDFVPMQASSHSPDPTLSQQDGLQVAALSCERKLFIHFTRDITDSLPQPVVVQVGHRGPQ